MTASGYRQAKDHGQLKVHDSAAQKVSPEDVALKLRRRQFLHLAASAAAVPLVSRAARAETYPARPVRIIVPLSREVTAILWHGSSDSGWQSG
jgi:hypothetical protein